jgi:hypothetical protein
MIISTSPTSSFLSFSIVSPGQVRDNFQRILCFSWIVGDVLRGARNLHRRAMSFFLKKERRIEQCHGKA